MGTIRRITLFGGTGHTGERLGRELLRRGHEVTVVTRNPDGIIAKALAIDGVRILKGDMRDPGSLKESLVECDLLFSCVHIRHAVICLEACHHSGVARFMQMSSTRVTTQFPCPSSIQVRDGEKAITENGIVYTIIRPTMIFGGKRDANVENLVQWFKKRRWIFLPGNGSNLIQPVFVNDLVKVMADAVANEEISRNKIYTISGHEPITFRSFLESVSMATRLQKPIFIPIPLKPAMTITGLMPMALQKRMLTKEQLQRFAEDKAASHGEAKKDLDYDPTPFPEAMTIKVSGVLDQQPSSSS